MPFSSADCAMVFCVERVDVARIASKSAFLNMDGRLPLPLILGKSESQVALVFLLRVRGASFTESGAVFANVTKS